MQRRIRHKPRWKPWHFEWFKLVNTTHSQMPPYFPIVSWDFIASHVKIARELPNFAGYLPLWWLNHEKKQFIQWLVHEHFPVFIPAIPWWNPIDCSFNSMIIRWTNSSLVLQWAEVFLKWIFNCHVWSPSGKTNITIENHHFQWEKSTIKWSFSIAMLNYQKVPIGSLDFGHWP